MMIKKRLRVGLVGCGGVAQWAHIPALKKVKNAELVAVCDRNEELASIVAKNFRIHRYYADFPQMLEKEGLDMVEICTPPKTHASLSIKAIESGCHVLVEKPMAMTTKEADEMIRASKDSKVKLGVVHNKEF